MEHLNGYIVRRELPLAVVGMTFGRVRGGVKVDSTIRLDVVELGAWEKWSNKGREYLYSLDNKVKLDDIVTE